MLASSTETVLTLLLADNKSAKNVKRPLEASLQFASQEDRMRPDTERDYQARILRVLVHIQDHLDEELSLESLAAVACFSPYHFHRIFRGLVGESVKEHVRRLRLERAAHRLKFGDLAVTTIAFDAGYENHESFTRAFHDMFGEPPSRFREIHKVIPFKEVPSRVHYKAGERPAELQPTRAQGGSMDVRIERIQPLRLAFMRHLGPYDEVGATWGKLMGWAGRSGLLGPGTRILGIVYDDPEVTPPDKVRYDACLAVDERFRPQGEVGAQEIAAGEYAVTTHRGPYQKLGETYARLCGEWLPGSGREAADRPCFEIYRNSLQNTRPEDLLTDIYLPLKKAV